MTPFERFFAGDWQRLLEQVEIPRDVMDRPSSGRVSWDRTAAYLLWEACGGNVLEGLAECGVPLPDSKLTEDGY